MAEILPVIENKIDFGQMEIKQNESNWKYRLADDDLVIIPEINFNIQTNYSTLENKPFQSNNKKYQLKKASQTTAFILNEKGAEIKSEAKIQVVTMAKKEEKKQWKRMILDRPFFLMARRKEAKYPYLGIWITNPELMIKE